MAEKISKLAITVDLQCHRCYKKIQKILCDLQEREKIKTISFDDAKNTVTISGPFDPQKLSMKLRCKACKVIKDIKIIEEKKKEEPKPKDPKPQLHEIVNDVKITVDLPKDLKEEPKPKPPEKEKPECKPCPQPPPCKPCPPPRPCEPCPPPMPCPPPVCCWIPCYMPYPGGSQCCSCGNVCESVPDCPPIMPPWCGSSCRGCNICKPRWCGPSCRGCNICKPPWCGPSCRGCNICKPPWCGSSCRGCKNCRLDCEENPSPCNIL